MVHLQTNVSCASPVLTWVWRSVPESQVSPKTFSTALLTTFSP